MYLYKYFFTNTLKTQKQNYLPEVDGLRAVAVILVLIFHLNTQGIFPGGFIGVDVFFVISGFLITGIIYEKCLQNNFSYWKFLELRIARLYPALLFIIFIVLVLGFLFYTPEYYVSAAKAGKYALFSVGNVFFARAKGYWDLDSTTNPFLHTWSLAVEQQFYLVWPLIIGLLFKLKKRDILNLILFGFAIVVIVSKYPKFADISGVINNNLYLFIPVFVAIYITPRKHILLVSLIIISLLSLYMAEILSASQPVKSFYLMPTRIFELGAGGVWYIFSKNNIYLKQNIKNIYKEIIFTIGFVVIVYCAYRYHAEIKSHPGIKTLPVVIASIFCMYGGSAKYLGSIIRHKLAVYLGLISYSVYLIHWPLIIFYRSISLGDGFNISEMLGLFLLSLILGSVMYIFIENRYRRISFSSFNKKCVIFLLIIVLLFFSCSYIIKSNGIESRLKEQTYNKELAEYAGIDGIGFQKVETTLGDNNVQPSVIFIGDSLANQYGEEIDQFLKNKNLSAKFFTGPGCTFFKGEDHPIFKGCKSLVEDFYSYIAINKMPIVYIQFVRENNNLPDYVSMLHSLYNESNHNLLIIPAQPIAKDIAKVKQCLISPTSKYNFLNNSCESNYIIKNDVHTLSNHLTLLIDKPKLNLINVTNLYKNICNENFCPYLDENGIPLYYDENHLSRHGAKRAWQGIEEEVYQFIVNENKK